MVADISSSGTGCSTLWQPHLPVNTTEVATGSPRFAWKMAVKTVHVCVCVCLCAADWSIDQFETVKATDFKFGVYVSRDSPVMTALKIFLKGGVCKNSVGGDMHTHKRLTNDCICNVHLIVYSAISIFEQGRCSLVLETR